MKIEVTLDIAPGTNAAQGTAQHLLEQIAIQVASGQISGTLERRHKDKTESYASATFTVTPDAPKAAAKPAKS